MRSPLRGSFRKGAVITASCWLAFMTPTSAHADVTHGFGASHSNWNLQQARALGNMTFKKKTFEFEAWIYGGCSDTLTKVFLRYQARLIRDDRGGPELDTKEVPCKYASGTEVSGGGEFSERLGESVDVRVCIRDHFIVTCGKKEKVYENP